MRSRKLYHAWIMATTSESETAYGLAFKTSSALGEVALGQGSRVIEARAFSGPRRHAVEFLSTVDAICRSHQVRPSMIKRVYVSCGPGSFTGLRIGISAARAMGLACNARIVTLPTLEIIAQNAMFLGRSEGRPLLLGGDAGGVQPSSGVGGGWSSDEPPQRVAVVLDAKRKRVYAAAFVRRDDRYVATTDAIEADPAEFLAGQRAIDKFCAVLGEGILYHKQAVEASGLPIVPESLYQPRAETVYRLGVAGASEGKFTDRRALIPTYIRPPEAEEKWNRRHGGQQS